MIGPGGLLLVVPPPPSPISYPPFNFIGGVAKEYITKLGCEKSFLRFTYSACSEYHTQGSTQEWGGTH